MLKNKTMQTKHYLRQTKKKNHFDKKSLIGKDCLIQKKESIYGVKNQMKTQLNFDIDQKLIQYMKQKNIHKFKDLKKCIQNNEYCEQKFKYFKENFLKGSNTAANKYLFTNYDNECLEEAEIDENCHSEERKESAQISLNVQSAEYKFHSILNEKLIQSTIIPASNSQKDENLNYNNDNSVVYCSCGKDSSIPCCKRAKNWMELISNEAFSDSKYENLKDQYLNIKNTFLKDKNEMINDRNYLQIRRDLDRTYPSNKLLNSKEFQTKLQNVLYLYSRYDPPISN